MDRFDALPPELLNRFRHHPPEGQAIRLHEETRLACTDLAVRLEGLLPDGREKALAMTNLEQVCMWANAAIARHPQP